MPTTSPTWLDGMDDNLEVDVLICGAGPVGLTLALLLARLNLTFLIIDKRTWIDGYSRAFMIQPRTLEIFQQLGVLDSFTEKGSKTQLSVNGYINGDFVFDAQLPVSNSSVPFTLILFQSETERILDVKLNSLGYKVYRSCQLEHVYHNEEDIGTSGSIVNLETDEHKIVKFKYLIGCDGSKSFVRQNSGISFIGQSSDLRLLCFDMELLINLPRQVPLSMFYDEVNSGAFFWINNQTGRFMFTLDKEERYPTKTEMMDLAMSLASKQDLVIKKLIWTNKFKIHECIATTYYSNNIFLCGDAAHTFSPAGAQGMNTGIQDAYNLAWKLSLLVKDICNENIIKTSYHDERSKVAKRVIEHSGTMLRNGLAKPTWSNNFVKRHILPLIFKLDWVKSLASDYLSEVDIEYDTSPLICKNVESWLSTSLSFIGKRMDNHPIISISGKITSIHTILTGLDRFDILIYIPSLYFDIGYFDQLYPILISLDRHPLLSQFNSTLYNLRIVTNLNMFQIDHWAHTLSATLPPNRLDDIFSLKKTLLKISIFLDHTRWGESIYNLTVKKPTTFIIRPDGYIAMISPLSPDQAIQTYFNQFLNMSLT